MNSIKAAAIAVLLIAFGGVLLLFEAVAGKFVESKHYVGLQKDYLEFYEKHYKELHHLRDPHIEGSLAGLMKTPESLMFSVIGNGPQRVLIQGDSWAEQFLLSEPTRNVLEDFSGKGYTFTLSGTTSYAPSPMTVQLRKLRSEFGVKADYVVAVVDQTDIGDELCRYRNQRQYVDGKLFIRPYPFDSREIYSLEKLFAQQDIVYSNDWALTKVFKLAHIRFNAMLRSDDSAPKCGWDAISRPLREGVSAEDRQYFLSVLEEYVGMVFSAAETTRLFLVTHPHRLHDVGEYKLDVRELLLEAVSKSEHKSRISIIDFPRVTGKPADLTMYREGDPASHLTDESHAKNYVPPILKSLRER